MVSFMTKCAVLALSTWSSWATEVAVDSTAESEASAKVQPRPSPEKLLRHLAMIKPVHCEPSHDTCSPQCPSAKWDPRTQRVFFDWTPDASGCGPLFKPDQTVVFLYTFYEYMDPLTSSRKVKDKIVLALDDVAPVDCIITMSKPVSRLFEDSGNQLLPNERYYVGAMY